MKDLSLFGYRPYTGAEQDTEEWRRLVGVFGDDEKPLIVMTVTHYNLTRFATVLDNDQLSSYTLTARCGNSRHSFQITAGPYSEDEITSALPSAEKQMMSVVQFIGELE